MCEGSVPRSPLDAKVADNAELCMFVFSFRSLSQIYEIGTMSNKQEQSMIKFNSCNSNSKKVI